MGPALFRTLKVFGLEFIATALWAVISPDTLSQNAPLIGGVGVLFLLLALFWERFKIVPRHKVVLESSQATLKPQGVTHDVDLSEGFAFAVCGQWGQKLSALPRDHVTVRQIEAVKDSFEQGAADGEIMTWGRPVYRPVHVVMGTNWRPMEKEMWYDRKIAWDSIYQDDFAETYSTAPNPDITYVDIRVNKAQFEQRWPPSNSP